MSDLLVKTVDFIRSLYPGKDTISLHEPHFGGNEKKYLLDCIDSTYVSSVGKYVDKFEELVRNYTGSKYAVATVNGTAALHVALLQVNTKRGDLVITQPLTFIATCNAISYCGAQPLFIDVDFDTLGLSASALDKFLATETDVVGEHCILISTGQKISACVPMHTFGHPCEIDRIVEICENYHIPVIEDAAESIGSLYNEKHTGTFGLIGTLSFNGNKTITTGGGGMLLTDDEDIYKAAKHITTQAKIPHRWEFRHDKSGYNYRMPNINAALGCAQIENLDNVIKEKRNIADLYKDFYSAFNQVSFITEPKKSRSNYWLNAIYLESEYARDELLKFTNDNQIFTRPCWQLMIELPMFSNCITSELPHSRYYAERIVNLPSGVRL